MNTMVSKFVLLSLLCFAPNLWADVPVSPRRTETATVAQARELVDTYYGGDNLLRAARLLEQAYQADKNDSNVYIQAARITAMGGAMTFGRFEGGTIERYGALLDRAIALDAANPKAHILKAQVFEHQGNYGEELSELDKAKALGTKDPWLLLGYGSYYRKVKATSKAYDMFSEVEQKGTGATASERKAYVAALYQLRNFQIGNEDMTAKLRNYAALALKGRYPADAWTPMGYAENFIDRQLFDDAIFYAREALKTMDFGAGRLTLAASLYAKAAQLLMEGRFPKEARPFIDEARTFGFSKAEILEYVVQKRGFGDSLSVLAPTLSKIVN